MGNGPTNKSESAATVAATDEIRANTYPQFTKKREETEDEARAEGRLLDKWVLTLSSGALLFSWTIFKDIGQPAGPKEAGSLTVAWCLLVVAIITS